MSEKILGCGFRAYKHPIRVYQGIHAYVTLYKIRFDRRLIEFCRIGLVVYRDFSCIFEF